ncbi:MAG TPA: hypothetical protein VIT91_10900 [Chthoniobacterales bacterium]
MEALQTHAREGDLDLIAILKEFHVQMIQSYAVFVAKTFFPELHPASAFYACLTREAHERDPNARMVFFSEKPEFIPGDGGKVSVNILTFVPNDLFAQFGIKSNGPNIPAIIQEKGE